MPPSFCLSTVSPNSSVDRLLLSFELYDKAPKSPIAPTDSKIPEIRIDSVVSRPLLQVPDFNSLIARSPRTQCPVFELTEEQLNQKGVVLETYKKSMSVSHPRTELSLSPKNVEFN